LNYRHQFHAGNFADALKHAILIRLIRSLQKKEGGYLFVDTHAGRGSYDLSLARVGDTRAREPEWPGGIGKLWNRADLGPELSDYLAQVRAFDRASGNLAHEPRYYPGSPELARLLARPQDRIDLWEQHEGECAALRAEFKSVRRISVHEDDGYRAPRAALPPPERRALVLVDPPFEDREEPSRILAALAEGLARMPAAVIAVWYPLTERADGEGVEDGFARLGRPVNTAELRLRPAGPPPRKDSPGAAVSPVGRLAGCGVAVVNPPWKFELELTAIAEGLAEILGEEGSRGTVRQISGDATPRERSRPSERA